MSYIAPITPVAEVGEEEFLATEIFFSRTDQRGVIRSGNMVFRRVSGFDWPQLLGAPHRVIRHPDTPRGIFWLLWRTLEAGKPMVAFIKNRSAQGRWYWVLAVVVPAPGGFVSVRIKPSGALFQAAKGMYAEILADESDLTPEQSGHRILARLASMGFPSYSDFAATALGQELATRGTAEGKHGSLEAVLLGDLMSRIAETGEKQATLMQEFDALQSIPTNMRIIASRLEPSGGPVSAISDNYKFASAEISRRLESFAGAEHNLCLDMADLVRDGMVLALISRLIHQVQDFLASEDNRAVPVDFAAELAIFQEVANRYRQAADETMTKAELACETLNLSSGEIRRMMLGLDTIRVMGRVESGRLGEAGAGLSAAIDQLDQRHARLAKVLQELMDLSSALKSGISAYGRQFGA